VREVTKPDYVDDLQGATTEAERDLAPVIASVPVEGLEYRTGRGWRPLPWWACFMMGVGSYAASRSCEGRRLVVALSIPARAFAASLVAAGVVVTSFLERPPERDALRHLEYLSGLPEGTSVIRRVGNSIVRGRLLAVESVDGVERVSVLFKGGAISRLPLSLCTQIQPTDGRAGTAMSTRRLVRAPGFLGQVCPALDSPSFCSTARLDCVLVGSQSALREELMADQFRATGGAPGTLQDLVRARYLRGATDAFRSTVVSATGEPGDGWDSRHAPSTVIFDGGTAFNNCRSQWSGANWVVLLDRSSPSATDAAAAVMESFAMRADEAPFPEELSIPGSIEALSWIETA